MKEHNESPKSNEPAQKATNPPKPMTSFNFVNYTTRDLFDGAFNVKVLKQVGSGYEGTVMKCAIDVSEKGRTGLERIVAMKLMSKCKTKSKSAENEVKILKMVDGPNVLEFVTAVECLDSYWIVTEFCDLGDLHGRLRYLDNCQVMSREYMLQVVIGLESLHNKLIVHSDIKMKNILISSNNVAKIGDFGFARRYRSSDVKVQTCLGTKDYWAPEMLVTSPLFDPFKADIYALGVTFVGVCEKRPIKRKHDNIYSIISNYHDAHQVSLFKGILSVNPNQRSGFEQIKSNIWLNECMTPPVSPL